MLSGVEREAGQCSAGTKKAMGPPRFHCVVVGTIAPRLDARTAFRAIAPTCGGLLPAVRA